jgi:hypothetical protein
VVAPIHHHALRADAGAGHHLACLPRGGGGATRV